MGKHLITHLESRDTDKKFRVESIDGGSASNNQRELGERKNVFQSEKTTLQGAKTPLRATKLQEFLLLHPPLSRCLTRVLISFLLVTSMVTVTGVPMLAIGKVSNYYKTLEMVDSDSFHFEDEGNEGLVPVPEKGRLDEGDLETIRSSIVEGLGLDRIPDPSKVRATSYNLIFRFNMSNYCSPLASCTVKISVFSNMLFSILLLF